MATSSKDIETLWNRYSNEVNVAGIAENNSTLRIAHNSTPASPTIQHSKRYATNFIIRRFWQAPMAS